MVTPQDAYDSIKGMSPDVFYTGFCKDYLGCWAFPYLPKEGTSLGGFTFVDKETGRISPKVLNFRMDQYIASPDVSDQVDFSVDEVSHPSDHLEHHGIKGMKWGVWNEETKAKRGVGGRVKNVGSRAVKYAKANPKKIAIGAAAVTAIAAGTVLAGCNPAVISVGTTAVKSAVASSIPTTPKAAAVMAGKIAARNVAVKSGKVAANKVYGKMHDGKAKRAIGYATTTSPVQMIKDVSRGGKRHGNKS